MAIFVLIGVDEDILQIHNEENIKLFRKNFIDIFLEACWYVC